MFNVGFSEICIPSFPAIKSKLGKSVAPQIRYDILDHSRVRREYLLEGHASKEILRFKFRRH